MSYKRIDQYDEKVTQTLSDAFSTVLNQIGEDPTREGLVKTPERAAKAMQFLTQGYNVDIDKLLNEAIFEEEYNQMVIVRDIEVYSLCEHHMLPFFGKAQVAYIPKNKIIGLSKVPRVVDAFARRLQVQERLTNQVRDCLIDVLDPAGVAVVIEAQHFCMQMRGVEKQQSFTTTSAFSGEFLENHKTREEFISLIR